MTIFIKEYNSMIKRLIFDIDGTLIRNVQFKDTITETLKETGIYSDKNLEIFLNSIKDYEKHYDNYNSTDYLNFFGNQLGINLDSNFLEIFFKHLKTAIPDSFDEIQEIQQTLQYLSKKYELVLLSNYFEKSQRNRLEAMGINKYFKKYYGENKIKPYAEAYLQAKGIFKPSECIIIGDDLELDIKKPSKLGFKTILVTDNENILMDTIKIQNIKELREVL